MLTRAAFTLVPGISYGIWHDWDGKPVKEAPLFYQNCNEFTGNVLFELSNEIMVRVWRSGSGCPVAPVAPGPHCFSLFLSLSPPPPHLCLSGQACKEAIERETGVNMGPLQHINDYQIEVYGHCIDDTSTTARVSRGRAAAAR